MLYRKCIYRINFYKASNNSTAGVGSRLDLNTKHYNKSMIQIGDAPVISKIIDSYPKNFKFIIITYYKGDHIQEYLKIIYPKK